MKPVKKSIMNFLPKTTKKFIYKYSNRILSLGRLAKSQLNSTHEFMRINNWYKLLFLELVDVLLMGFFISLALVAFGLPWKPWLALSYGLVPWLLIYVAKSFKRELKK